MEDIKRRLKKDEGNTKLENERWNRKERRRTGKDEKEDVRCKSGNMYERVK